MTPPVSNPSMNLLKRFTLATVAIIFCFPVIANACSCAGTSTLADAFAGSRAVFTGKVLYTNRSLKWKWMRALYYFYDLTNITPPEYNARRDGVSVTFEVMNSWKGQDEDVVTLRTGYGGGDCGIPFEAGDEALIFVSKYYSDWYDMGICSRTQSLADATADIVALGPPMKKIKHKSLLFHLIAELKSLQYVLIISLAAILIVYFRIRKKNRV